MESLHRAAVELHIGTEVSALSDDVGRLWADVATPRPWELPESVWSEEADAANARAHYAAVKAFHGG